MEERLHLGLATQRLRSWQKSGKLGLGRERVNQDGCNMQINQPLTGQTRARGKNSPGEGQKVPVCLQTWTLGLGVISFGDRLESR